MALINCPECGAKVSEKASPCPYCGFDVDLAKRLQRAKEEEEERDFLWGCFWFLLIIGGVVYYIVHFLSG